MAQTWQYSDWITFATGSAARLSQLRLHIKEVSDCISTGSYSSEGKSHDKDSIEDYLKKLLEIEKSEAAATGGGAGGGGGTRAYFTRARANL